MPLTVIITGAGIGGLAAAIGLARSGHTITIFEKSAFKQEVGAAIHIGPQATKVLLEWGMKLEELDPCIHTESIGQSISDDHKMDFHHDVKGKLKAFGCDAPYITVHRVDLHNALRQKAESFPNVTIKLASAVTHVDPTSGTITLADNSTHTADLIVGADGVHSTAVKAIEDLTPVPSSFNQYRFMIPTEILLSDPGTKATIESWDYKGAFMSYIDPATYRYLIIYPCRGGNLLNFASLHPAKLDHVEIGDTWNSPGTKENVIDLFKGYPEKIMDIIQHAEDVKHWKAVNRHCPRKFVQDRLVLLGDAAHPMKPLLGAGGATAIEDGGVLGTMLAEGTTPDDLPRLLDQYQKIRYDRGVILKYMSEPPDQKWEVPPKEKMGQLTGDAKGPEDVYKYLWTYDAFKEANKAVQVVM